MAFSLKDIALFAETDERHLEELQHRARPTRFERGEALFLQGDKARGLYVLRSGRVKVFISSPQGRQQILHLAGPGESVGEVAVFCGETYPATAEALARTEVLVIPKQALLEMIIQEPETAMAFLAGLSRRLREFANRIADLSLLDVSGRLASYLLYQSRDQPPEQPVSLGMSKAQLASLLGTVPETLSRALQRLARDHLISLHAQSVLINDRDALQKATWSRDATWAR
jgi:CRP/FNR family transcriptional regulator, dissimilatory nitrate respiration regulator